MWLKEYSNRIAEINNKIMTNTPGAYKLRRISYDGYFYVLTLKKIQGSSFLSRVELFYNTLLSLLNPNEILNADGENFCVVSKSYKIIYNVEGYKKNADLVGAFEGNKCIARYLKRMGTEKAFSFYKQLDLEKQKDILARMNFTELKHCYQNLASRFVASLKITNALAKTGLNIRYSDIGYYSSEILFHIIPETIYVESKSISVLKIEEETATFILPIVNEFYQDFYDNYYLTENRVPAYIIKEIKTKIEKYKCDFVDGNVAEFCEKYLTFLNLYIFKSYNTFYNVDDIMIKDNPQGFLLKHREKVIKIFDIFIKWTDAQYKHYDISENVYFNIQGP
jgi:hypothetical protein